MKYIDFRVKLLSHGQTLEISDALITDSKPTQMKSPTQTLPGPILNTRSNSYFEPRNINK